MKLSDEPHHKDTGETTIPVKLLLSMTNISTSYRRHSGLIRDFKHFAVVVIEAADTVNKIAVPE